MKMRLKITVTGPRVHDVDYELFLMNLAALSEIKMFEAYSIEGDGKGDGERERFGGKEQKLKVLIDGGEIEAEAFRKLAELRQPAKAIVSKIVTEEHQGVVMRIENFSQILVASQLSRAIPLFFEMKEDIKSIKEELKELKWEVKNVTAEVREMNEHVKTLTGM